MQPTGDARLRTARAADATVLSALAMRSKAQWGYDPDFLERCRDELTVGPVEIADENVVLAESGDRPRGFFGIGAIADSPDDWDVLFFFVDPEAIGSGIGRQLWSAMLALARRRGVRRIFIESDPQAEGFYRRMGARRVGEAVSSIDPRRKLPFLDFDLAA